ncbi:hypothetical protein [Streptomyces marispadix]|uniref:Transmembrane protein n=1 Tax=Streptomyces marispadix TaxID=2922868 RepID=A0ABS9SZP6_9ACTN|nr:hypothetical protein [Streptomyces marispadix]MCH6161511.1 hypothetical protein [Streptomyces marispadix]
MHMNSAPHLLPEDRPEFERAVDEALREAGRRPALTAVGERISADRLRVMALSAATAIAADAAEEYEQYVALRTRLRESAAERPRGHNGSAATAGSGSAPSAARPRPGTDAADEGEQRGRGGGLSLAGVGEGVGETAGAGLLAMVSVLVPLLAGTAAVIFLLLGYLLRIVSPEPSIAAPMRGAGWVFAVLAAAGIVVAMAELWLTALRNGAGARRSAGDDEDAEGEGRSGGSRESRLAREVSTARTVWRQALLERGIVPFLADALDAQPGKQSFGTGRSAASQGTGRPTEGGSEGSAAASSSTSSSASTAGSSSTGGPVTEAARTGKRAEERAEERAKERAGERTEERTPRLGYSGPDFSSRSPSDGTERESVRPRYSSPDYSSPDYGGPEHKPE